MFVKCTLYNYFLYLWCRHRTTNTKSLRRIFLLWLHTISCTLCILLAAVCDIIHLVCAWIKISQEKYVRKISSIYKINIEWIYKKNINCTLVKRKICIKVLPSPVQKKIRMVAIKFAAIQIVAHPYMASFNSRCVYF